MLSDAYVRLECDRCETREELSLTALARSGTYGMTSIPDQIRRLGWGTNPDDDEFHLCPDCAAKEAPGDEHQR